MRGDIGWGAVATVSRWTVQAAAEVYALMMRAVVLAGCTLLPCTLPLVPQAQLAATGAQAHQQLRSRIFVYDLGKGTSTLVYTADTIWEAPSWSPDGKYLISNSGGAIYKLALLPDGSAKPERLAIPAEYRCNNDKAISPDGTQLAFSATLPPAKNSNVYLANADGTHIRAMTHEVPSYFHGWSPDGKTLAFVAQRNGLPDYNILRMPAAGGAEIAMTKAPGHNDGPDYSPDGKWLYLNSDRTGRQSIYRMASTATSNDDARAELLLADGDEDWFPHPSPDGRKLVYIAYPAGTATHNPRTVQVKLRLAAINNNHVASTASTLVIVTGGQGTLNVNSWAPHSDRFAYVSYEVLPAQ